MKRVKLLPSLLCSAGFLALILDGKTALSGAQTGMDLCIRTVIPSLFPFFLLSIYFTGTLSGVTLGPLFPLGRLCGIPEGAEGILIPGFLGGYPTGAQAVGDGYRSSQLSRQDANRMLLFCSNAGPAFLFGMAGTLFSEPATPFLLWAIHIGSALLVSQTVWRKPGSAVDLLRKNKISAASAMMSSVRVMAVVCGWVVLFRLVIAFLERWIFWLLPDVLQVAAAGFLELSNGCIALRDIPDPKVRFLLCSGMLSWGGLCVMMQTRSVIGDLSLGAYLRGKVLQTLFSLLLSFACITGIGLPVLGLLCLVAMILRNMQKRDSFPAVSGV